MSNFKKPSPLKVKCTDADCENNLHCFKKSSKMTPDEQGKCRSCGVDLVDWKRIHQRDKADAEHTFTSLKYELIRHHFFHRNVDDQAMRHAQRKGRIKLKEAARHRLEKYLAVANPPYDGRQTPMEGNAIFYAQHATATCCRKCLDYWHAIPEGRTLTPEELDYCVTLVGLFLDEKLPELADEPIKVPRRQDGVIPEPEESQK